MQAPYSCPEQTSYSWGSTLTPYPIASLVRTTCIDPPRTRMKSISTKRWRRAGFHNQRDNPSWALPQDIPLHTRSIALIYLQHTAIFNGFSHRQNERVVTCPFLQASHSPVGADETVQVWDTANGGNVFKYDGYKGVVGSYPIGKSNENVVPCSPLPPSTCGSRRNVPPWASTMHLVI